MERSELTRILALPIGERIKLAQSIWDSVAETSQPYPLTDAERQDLDRRVKAYRKNPDQVTPWPEVKRRILAGK